MALTDLTQAELEAYRPKVPEPDDFDDFWTMTLAEARALSAPPVVAPPEGVLAHVDVRDVTFSGFGGHPIKAWYARPTGVSQELPCVVEIAGYGGGRGLPFEHTMWPAAGYAHLFIDTRGQGSSWGAGGETADPVGSEQATPGFMTKGIGDPATYYYRRVMTDAVLAVDVARGLAGVDPTKLVFRGGSQGGGIAIAVAGLVPDLAAVMPDVPFLCHFRRGVEIAAKDPFAEIARYLAVHRDKVDQVFHTLSYFDGVNHAKRGRAPSLWSVALMDETVPPSTIYAAYHRYGELERVATRQMAVYQFNGHEGGDAHQVRRQMEFLREVLG